MYVGNALYMYVAEVLFGVTWVIHDDREHYMTLKQVYIAPINFYAYILGRSAIKIAITTAGVVITLLFGVLVLGVDIFLGDVDWLLLTGSVVLGMGCICVLGLASISKVLPVTYWMDSMRRALMPEAMETLRLAESGDITGLGGFSDLYIMAFLAVSAAVFFVLSLGVFRYADAVARRKGKIDWTTSY